MKLQQKHRQMIALGCGVVLILLGLVQGVFNVNISKNVSETINFILIITAALMILSGRNKKDASGDQQKQEDGVNACDYEANKIETVENKPSDN